MEDLTKISNFTKILLEHLSSFLVPLGYKYTKSKEMFSLTDKLYNYKFYIYPNKRGHTISIDTKGYISPNYLDEKFKNSEIVNLNSGFCGGYAKKICEEYFRQEYWNNYEEMLFHFEEEKKIDRIVERWRSDFENIFIPFFEDCRNSKQLNQIINRNVESLGFCRTYKVKAMYSLDVAKMADLSDDELLKLAANYEGYLKKEFDDGGKLLDVFQKNKNSVADVFVKN